MFDSQFYGNFHLDIKALGWNEKQLKESYEKYGKNEGRMSCESDFYNTYPEFNLEFYKNNYSDLNIFNGDKYMLMWHYHNFGNFEGRLDKKKFYLKYPNLFSKYLLDISNPDNELNYNVIENKSFENNCIITHIHIFDINNFEYLFNKYIENIFYFSLFFIVSISYF